MARKKGKWRNKSALSTIRLCGNVLKNNDAADDEVNVIARHKTSGMKCVTQTVSFIDLPAEIRNRVYHYALPSSDEKLVVATPFKDELMRMGDQPAITRTCRQVRKETLATFYAKSKFVAYLDDANVNVERLAKWCHAVSPTLVASSATLPLHIHIKLVNSEGGSGDVTPMMRTWAQVPYDNFHLRVQSSIPKAQRSTTEGRIMSNRVRVIVDSIEIAEDMARSGEFGELVSGDEYSGRLRGRFDEKSMKRA